MGRRFVVAPLLLVFTADALAGQPTDQLKPEIDRVLKVLEDPGLKGEARTKERRDALRAATSQIFDWREMARRALGRHWRNRTDAEREEFVALFRDLLERSYASTIERYSGEQIVFTGDSVEGDQASVRTKLITRQGREVPIDYRMLRTGDRWLVFDVSVEGISLVHNYRAQFNQIIQTSSYEDLVRRMRSLEFIQKAS